MLEFCTLLIRIVDKYFKYRILEMLLNFKSIFVVSQKFRKSISGKKIWYKKKILRISKDSKFHVASFLIWPMQRTPETGKHGRLSDKYSIYYNEVGEMPHDIHTM